jgi:hypothetical protein
MKSTTIKLFLINGDPKGLRTAQLSNWSGKSVAGPRSQLEELRKRDESKKPGVYMLIGKTDDTGENKIYIGETEVIENRIFQHLEKEFWNQAVFFVSKDENLTKSHTKYLENLLIAAAKAANRYLIDNANSSGAKLPEEDRAEMDEFFENVLRLAPIMGIEAFIPITGAKKENNKIQEFATEIKGLRATGFISENGFVIKKGSQAVPDLRDSCPEAVSRIRKELLEKQILKKEAKHLLFLQNHEFNSPSLAAGIIHGGSANGRNA